MTPEPGRQELARLIDAKGLDLANVSRSLGMNHAYLQQFIRGGTPRWLREDNRQTLEGILGTKLDFLRPPPKEPKRPAASAEKSAAIAPDKVGRFVNQPEQLALLDLWDAIELERDRIRLLRMLKAFVSDAAAKRG